MPRKLNCFVALVDGDQKNLTVQGYSFGSLRSRIPFIRPKTATPTVLHTESLPAGIGETGWSERLETAGYRLDGYPWGGRSGNGWLMILAEQQAVA